MTKKTVLFDMDGVLLNTIDLWVQAYLHVLQDYNITLSEQEFIELYYHQGAALPAVLSAAGISDSVLPVFREQRDSEYVTLLKTNDIWYDDAKQLLETLREQQVPRAIITGSWQRYVDAVNDNIQLNKFFDIMITADDMSDKQKPDPYGLTLAMDALQAQPSDCVYIGDMPFDMEAANAAHVTAILIARPSTPEHAKKSADIVFNDLSELSAYLD